MDKENTKTRTKYLNAYNAAHYKRVSLNIAFDEYNNLKTACDSLGVPVNTFIKQAIADKLDDIECNLMYERYLNDPDPEKDETCTLEEFKAMHGL